MQHARFPQQPRMRKQSGVTFLPKAAGCFQCVLSNFAGARFEFRRGPFLEYKICAHHHFVGDVMARLLFGIIVVAVLSVPFVAVSYNESSAQERATCSQARAHCGTQRVCQRRYEACMETGCWTVTLVRRCGYEKR
jgi:hypothetical protein